MKVEVSEQNSALLLLPPCEGKTKNDNDYQKNSGYYYNLVIKTYSLWHHQSHDWKAQTYYNQLTMTHVATSPMLENMKKIRL
jgi:hypothetical protein